MSTFALDVGSSNADIVTAINYAISNLGTGVTTSGNVGANVVYVNTTTGQITSNSSGTIGYLYGFVNVKYANSATGSSGFSSNCRLSNYYGVHNTTDGSISSNPVDYNWFQVTGGFGTTKGLYYQNVGGYQAKFSANAVAPNQYYTPVRDNTAIALLTLAPSIVTSNTIQAGAVTNVSIASNTIQGNNIQSGTITGNLIAANTIVGTSIIAQTVYGNAIIANTLNANTIQANTFQANTINGNSIVAGSITADKLAANTIIVANSIQSSNAIFGNTSSPGYWLDSTTGNVRMGGNVSIGANLTVAGLITAGGLIANTVQTNNLINNSVTQVLTYQTEFGSQQVTPVANSAARSIWPLNSRGVALSGTITPTSNGSIGGSSIKINYSAFISSTTNSQYNLMELWKYNAGQTYPNYTLSFRKLRSLWPQINSSVWPLSNTPLGLNVSAGVGTNGANVICTNGSTYTVTNTGSSTAQNSLIGYYTTNVGNTAVDTYNLFNGGVATSPQMLIYDSEYIAWTANNIIRPVISVGSSGTIMRTTDASYLSGTAENTPVITDLYGVAVNMPPMDTTALPFSGNTRTNVIAVAVGANGVILRDVRTYNSSGTLTSGGNWTLQTSGVTNNLNSVSYNLLGAQQGTMQFVAVGDGGAILNSPDGITWTKQNYYTSAGYFANQTNLHDIAYCSDVNGNNWYAIGENGLVLTKDINLSTATIWNTITTYTTRNFYSALNPLNRNVSSPNDEVYVGDEIIHTPGPNSGGTIWPYLGNASFTSNGYQRLQFLGSYPDLTGNALPPAGQQIANNQNVSSVFLDTNYSANVTQTYFLVVGNMNNMSSSQVYTANPTLTLTEQKR